MSHKNSNSLMPGKSNPFPECINVINDTGAGFITMASGKKSSRLSEINIGVIGYGFMGKAHSIAFSKMPCMFWPPPAIPKLVKICGRNEDRVAEEAKRYVDETGVDLLAPAVGNIHGMFRDGRKNSLDIERIKLLRKITEIPLVLHGGSGSSDEDFYDAIKAGMSIVHVSTEIRVAYRDAIKRFLQENPDETTPYKIMKEPIVSMQKIIEKRLQLFSKK